MYNQRLGAHSTAVISFVALIGILIGIGVTYAIMRSDGNIDTPSTSSSSAALSSSSSLSSATPQASSQTQNDPEALETCKQQAIAAHNQRWADACAGREDRTQTAMMFCLSSGRTEAECTVLFGQETDLTSYCDLQGARAHALILLYEGALEQCNTQYGG